MGTYSIGCYWNNRTESVSACADRAGRCLRRLEECDPAFGKVFVSSRARSRHAKCRLILKSEAFVRRKDCR